MEEKGLNSLQIKYFGKGFNFSQDGPGNRLVYHLYGCNFRCPWCSNPECFATDTKTTVASAAEIADEIIRSRPMFFSGGGVTFTGGEPTLQLDALKAILGYVHSKGIHTAIECNASSERLPELFSDTDWLMMDLKHTDETVHRELTGVSNQTVLENIRRAASERQLALRIPLITGYNTDSGSINGFIRFLTSLPSTREFTVELLPYHEYGKVKWEKHGMEYRITNGFVNSRELMLIRRKFTEAGLKIINT